MNHAEKADTLAALPWEYFKGRGGEGMEITHVFDRKYWTGFEGCTLLVVLNEKYTQSQKKALISEVLECRAKNADSAFNIISSRNKPQTEESAEDNRIIFEFLKICEIYKTYFDLREPITPRHFISWARERDSFEVPQKMIDWHENKKNNKLHSKNSNKQSGTAQENYEHGFCSLVIKMRSAGKPDSYIAEHLKSMGLSRQVIGALLTRDATVISESGFRAKCDRLLSPK